MSAIHEITLNDYESSEFERPSMPKLRLAIADGKVFLTIVKVTETYHEYKQEPVAEVGVKLDDLRDALALLNNWGA